MENKIQAQVYKKFLRKIKIGNIFNIDVPNLIITSTPKGISLFKEIWK